MTRERKRSIIILASLGVMLLLGVLFFDAIVRFLTELRLAMHLPVCVFNDLFAIRCPLCGATRCCAALMAGDIGCAFYYNPLLPIAAAAFAVWYAVSLVRVIGNKRPSIMPENKALYAVMIITVVFTLVRNTPVYRAILY